MLLGRMLAAPFFLPTTITTTTYVPLSKMATAVLELACLHILPGTDTSSPDLVAKLKEAKTTMEAASKTGHGFHFFSCNEDASLIVLVGAWQSVKQHMEEFIPSDANQNLLQLLKDQISVEWMFHVDLVEPGFERYHEILQQPIVVFDRRMFELAVEEVHEYDGVRMAIEDHMKTDIADTEQQICGWRQGWNPGRRTAVWTNEYLVIGGWRTKEQYLKYWETENDRYDTKWLNHVSRVEAKFGVLTKLEDLAM